ncbi:MAG TPA: hypothetical protein VFF64_22310 [Candidatus Eremiobacteraceae bacterium]|nr:hypothetical protein [Candidatus Eremiobacteraceae bacterium]
MTLQSCAKVAGAVVTFVAIVLAGMSIKPPRAHADNDDDTDSRVRIGFRIAPVHLNLEGKDHDLVGLGSYLVNAVGDCNGCHSANALQSSFTHTPQAETRTLTSRRRSIRPST